MKLSDYYRAGDVNRWQIVKTLRQQSVAEHSFHVAILAIRIYDRLIETMDIGYPAEMWGSTYERNLLMQWALYHDIPEVLTGDIATPVKIAIRKAGIDPFSIIEGQVSKEYSALREAVGMSKLVTHVVKIADILESLKFLSINACTDHGKSVQGTIRIRLKSYLDGVNAESGMSMLKWQDVVREVHDELFGYETTIDDVLG